MEINLESELENSTLQNEEISNLIQELSNTLENSTVLVYNGYDCTKFTNENIEKIGNETLVKYENGTYSIIEGTSLYDWYPNQTEDYSKLEIAYVTKDKTSEELYKKQIWKIPVY